jgi:serine/threonine protein kinase
LDEKRRLGDGVKEHLKTLSSLAEPTCGSGAGSSDGCLSDDEILAFVKGQVHSSRMQKVHAHLDSCAECQQLLSEAAHALDADPISDSARLSWNTVFQPGAVIAKRYRILRLIARGGMGEVYEAFDAALHDRVAIKTVTATHCDNPDAVRLLKAEVQHARRIGHPNVCRIFDLGTHSMEPSGGEIQFLVMEFVEGECLGKKLRHSGALPLRLAQSVATQLLQGLAAAHQAGILHRDFKSDNVILRTDGNESARAIILDFGLAKALNESGNIVTTQQHSVQAMVGTIGYMAPEQIEGEPLTAASDIYSFGVVWFEMLTGRLPFEGDTLAASAVVRLHRAPEPPSQYNPAVPGWIDSIVLRCLERRRIARFTSAEQVLSALSAEPPTEHHATGSKRVNRNRPLSIFLGICAMVLLTTGAVRMRRHASKAYDAPQQRPAANVPRPTQPQQDLAQSLVPREVTAKAPLPTPTTRSSKHTNPQPRSTVKAGDALANPLPTASGPAQESPGAKSESSARAPAAMAPHEPDWLPLKRRTASSEMPLQVD